LTVLLDLLGREPLYALVVGIDHRCASLVASTSPSFSTALMISPVGLSKICLSSGTSIGEPNGSGSRPARTSAKNCIASSSNFAHRSGIGLRWK
jgi:hypothetical protein